MTQCDPVAKAAHIIQINILALHISSCKIGTAGCRDRLCHLKAFCPENSFFIKIGHAFTGTAHESSVVWDNDRLLIRICQIQRRNDAEIVKRPEIEVDKCTGTQKDDRGDRQDDRQPLSSPFPVDRILSCTWRNVFFAFLFRHYLISPLI